MVKLLTTQVYNLFCPNHSKTTKLIYHRQEEKQTLLITSLFSAIFLLYNALHSLYTRRSVKESFNTYIHLGGMFT